MLSFWSKPVDGWPHIQSNPGRFICYQTVSQLQTKIQELRDKYKDSKDEAPTSYPKVNYLLSWVMTVNQPFAKQVADLVNPVADKFSRTWGKDNKKVSAQLSPAERVKIVIPMLEGLLDCYRKNKESSIPSTRVAGYIDNAFEVMLGLSAKNITDQQFQERKAFLYQKYNIKMESKAATDSKAAESTPAVAFKPGASA